MIIIGVLASIAIPAFVNQQGRARDIATISDARTIGMAIQEAMVTFPDATKIAMVPGDRTSSKAMPERSTGVESGDVTLATLMVGDGIEEGEFTSTLVTLTKGTRFNTAISSIPSARVRTWNPKGKVHLDRKSGVVYDSTIGGLAINGREDWYVVP